MNTDFPDEIKEYNSIFNKLIWITEWNLQMSKTKKDRPALGADYSAKMKSRYAEKVKPSSKIYSKADRRENRVVGNMKEDTKEELLKVAAHLGHKNIQSTLRYAHLSPKVTEETGGDVAARIYGTLA